MRIPVKLSSKNFALASLLFAWANPSFAQFSVTTYHYDNSRTGWNAQENVLTPANVNSATFGLLTTVALDDQVGAQPLVMPSVKITSGKHQGLHSVVYVATEGNTIYAIATHTGKVLLRRNFGPPVISPQGCGHNVDVGIESTPVIDPAAGIMYAVVYTQTANGPTYYLHALDLGSLNDKVTPIQITATHTLTDGSPYIFDASVQRQRPALLLANGNVYAGFGSFCDRPGNLSRGWLLGWQTGTLTPLAGNKLLDTQATSPNTYFLSSIWMSGDGLAADYLGNILFVTGNSDESGTTYDGVTDIQESVIKVSADLTTVLDLFTPSDEAALDEYDEDFGSGGVMLLPAQAGSVPHIAVAAGKDGNMYMMNEDSLGGYSPVSNNVLGTYQIGGCWCGQSYFQPADGVPRVVSSGGYTVMVWKLATSPSPSLTLAASSPAIPGGQWPGFFTTVSSNGKANPIIWALSRPASKNDRTLYLYAFDPESGAMMTQLFSAAAGVWPRPGNSNAVPVVADGQVFVASYRQLNIFGLK